MQPELELACTCKLCTTALNDRACYSVRTALSLGACVLKVTHDVTHDTAVKRDVTRSDKV